MNKNLVETRGKIRHKVLKPKITSSTLRLLRWTRIKITYLLRMSHGKRTKG